MNHCKMIDDERLHRIICYYPGWILTDQGMFEFWRLEEFLF